MAGHTSDPDDWSDGRLDEHKALRESQIALFARICAFKPVTQPLLQMIVQLFDSLDPNQSPASQAEVPLQLMITLGQELSAEQRAESTETSDFFKLINYILSKDMLSNFKCVNSSALTLQKYMDMVYRWSCFYRGETIAQLIDMVFFSDITISNSDPNVVRSACQVLNRICSKSVQEIVPMGS